MKLKIKFFRTLFFCLPLAPIFGAQGAPEPSAQVPVRVHIGDRSHTVSRMIVGFNTSYFNDLGFVWATGEIEARLKDIRTGALRYPGGEETSRFHWEHPGVDGYMDMWNPAHPGGQVWQSVRVGKEKWKDNDLFVDLEKFIARCGRIGAEPIVGVNLSSGEVMNRRTDGIAEAVRLVRHIVERGYPVRYLFLDNEPWHKNKSNYHFFTGDTYAETYLAYAKAIREVAPHIKLVANPTSAPRLDEKMARFLSIAGAYTDVIDLHLYWEWGRATSERWKTDAPMRNSAKWISPKNTFTYAETLEKLKAQLDAHGYPKMDVAVLEWNLAPLPKDEPPMPASVMAMAQGEMLLQFAAADVSIACMWPLFWQVQVPGLSRTVEEEDDQPFRSPFEGIPPYKPTDTYAMLRLLKELPGAAWVRADSSEKTLVVGAARDEAGVLHIWAINKSAETRTVAFDGNAGGRLCIIGHIAEGQDGETPACGDKNTARLPPWSFTYLQFR